MIQDNYFYSFDGAKIFINAHIGTSKTWLVFLHGFGGDMTVWNAEYEYFENLGFSTLTVDLRGHGLSERRNQNDFYSLDNIAKDIKYLITELQIDNFILIGHCFGGMVAMKYCASFQHLPQALIVINSGFALPIIGGSTRLSRVVSKIAENMSRIINFHTPGHVNFTKFINTPDIHIKRFLSDVTHTSSRSYLQAFSQLTLNDLRPDLKNIRCPTLIICGLDDTLYKPQVAKYISKNISGSQLEFIKGANHVVVLNKPFELNEQIKTYLIKRGIN